jgi:hypothetical protein
VSFSRIATLALLTALVACEDPYLTNPSLRLLLKIDGHYLFSPVLSADQKKLYYLDDSSYDSHFDVTTAMRGDIWVRNLEDSTGRMLLQGTFCALALSANGQVLAALSKPENMNFVNDSTLYVVMDTAAVSADSVYFRHPGSRWGPWGVHISDAGDKLFFDGFSWHNYAIDSTLVYRIDLPGDTVTHVASYPWLTLGTDLLSGDSVYAESAIGTRASVNPRDNRWLVFPKSSGTFTNVWALRDRAADTLGSLGAKARPYGTGYIDWPTWTADGRDLVFSAMAPDSPGNTRLEVWMLEDALKDTARVQ